MTVGDLAPDFAIPADESRPATRLSDFRNRAGVVLFFYPKDDSPACTIEACAFRDSHEAFVEAGAEVIGISADTPDSHRRFASRRRLPYRLVSDADGSLRRLYGVPKALGLIAVRVTYVIGRDGVVRHVFNSQFRPWRHAPEALRALAGEGSRVADAT